MAPLSVFVLSALPIITLAFPQGVADTKEHTTTTKHTTTTSTSSVVKDFTPSAAFPSGVFEEWWKGYEPTVTSVEPQPVVTDPYTKEVYAFNVSSPFDIPQHNTIDPVIFPPSVLYPNENLEDVPATKNLSTSASLAAQENVYAEILSLANGTGSGTDCQKCQQGLKLAQDLIKDYPWEGPTLMIKLCGYFGYDAYSSCQQNFEQNSDGDMLTQIMYYADVLGQDGEYICSSWIDGLCDQPAPMDLTDYLQDYFASPKPADAFDWVPKPSGERVKVLHLSDFHLDPRYLPGAESDCSQYLCCRDGSYSTSSPNTTRKPAPRYGAFSCDTPYDLAGAALQAIPVLTGTETEDFDWGIFTGDLVSHDDDQALGHAYTDYTSASIYTMIKSIMGDGKMYATIGNHDSWPQAMAVPISFGNGGYLSKEFNWDWSHLAGIWETFGWIGSEEAAYASTHYGGYAITTARGLRVISINTDFWYYDNYFIYMNTTDPDISGTLRWLTDELQACEDAKQPVWLIGHIPPGWDGYNGLPNPTNLFYAIVERYSPHVIREIFFGHNHDDVFNLYYANNGTNASAETALVTAWITPSITPLTYLNSGFRYYDVDPVSFNVLDSYTFYSNVTAFTALEGQDTIGAPFHFEYSAREAYGFNIDWPETDPINATWWHLVTEQMANNVTLVNQFTQYEGKLSTHTANCTNVKCTTSKVCYMRSGSVPTSGLCPYGSTYGSVQ